MKRCPACHASDTDNVTYCHADGARLEATGARTLADLARSTTRPSMLEVVACLEALAASLEARRVAGQPVVTVRATDVEILQASGGDVRVVVTLPDDAAPEHLAPYRAPEASSRDAVPALVVVFDLGAIAYELLTGERPFDASSAAAVAVRQLLERPAAIRTVRSDVPADVEAVILQALSSDPQKRFASESAFVDALRRAATLAPTVLPPGSEPSEAHAAVATRRPIAWGLIGASAAVLLVVGGLVLRGSTPAPPAATPSIVEPPAPEFAVAPPMVPPSAPDPSTRFAVPVVRTAHSAPDASVPVVPLMHQRPWNPRAEGPSTLPMHGWRQLPHSHYMPGGSASGAVIDPTEAVARAVGSVPAPIAPAPAPPVRPSAQPLPVDEPAYGWLALGVGLTVVLLGVAGALVRRSMPTRVTTVTTAIPPTIVRRNEPTGPPSVLEERGIVGTEATVVSRPRAEPLDTAPGRAFDVTSAGAFSAFQVGQYLCDARLGEGGMGVVYKARHLLLDRPAAVKVLLATGTKHASFAELFRREAKLAASISHPNSVTIYDYGEAGSSLLYLAMEYLDGGTLADLVRSGPVAVPRVVDIVRQVSAGLDAAHALGIVHRDLKPQNLMVSERAPGKALIKIVDFGIARAMTAGDGESALSGMVVGTPSYMAPEQARGELDVDLRADVYGLAVVTWELLTGVAPFAGGGLTPMQQIVQRGSVERVPPPLPTLLPQVETSTAMDGVLRRAMAFERTQRPASAGDFAREFAVAAGQ